MMALAETPGLTSLDQERALSMADEGGAAAARGTAPAPAMEDGLAQPWPVLPAILAGASLLGFALCLAWRRRH